MFWSKQHIDSDVYFKYINKLTKLPLKALK